MLYPNEPTTFSISDIEQFLKWSTDNHVSDIIMVSDQNIIIRRYGKQYRCTLRRLTTPEVGGIVNEIYGPNGTAMLSSGKDIDTGFSIKIGRSEKIRFRFNATKCYSNGGAGYSISLRSIPTTPPLLADLNFPEHLIAPMSVKQGMVLITGSTGSGKSTLLSSVLRHRLEDPNSDLNVLTYESPIEFLYDEVEQHNNIIQQHEVPKDLATFELSVRNAMRRVPSVILIGESRDSETMKGSIEAAKSGHLLMTTLHSNGVSSTLQRALDLIPPGERAGKSGELIENLSVIITQRLLKTLDGKRAPILEYLVFDQQIKNTLMSTPYEHIPLKARELTKSHGQLMTDHAQRLYSEGVIGDDELGGVVTTDKLLDEDSKVELSLYESPAAVDFDLIRSYNNVAQ